MLNLAERFIRYLFAEKLAATQGIVLTPNGVEYTRPNPAALWPPHRPHPHRRRTHNSDRRLARRAQKKADGLVLGIKDGRLGYVSRHRLIQVCP